MKRLLSAIIAAAWLGWLAPLGGAAQAQPIPQVQNIGPNDLFPDIVNGNPAVPGYYANANQVGVFGATLPGGNYDNALIGGDFSTNLFQRGASVSTASSTYYVAYGADRWFTWGGTSTPTTMTQQTGAADIPPASSASYRINKGSLTGVKQICTSQVVESTGAYRFQGKTAEFTFDALAGAGFSAASSNLAVYVSYGTVADEGATYMAYGLNKQGGAGTTAWTGQVNLGGAAGFLIPITTSWARYGVEVPIPSTALEIGVSICYTPVGTGTSTDWFEFGKAALAENPAMTSFAGAAGAILAPGDPRMKAFARRPQQIETALQERYYWQVNEPAASKAIGTGNYQTSTICDVVVPTPVPMRIIPTITIGGNSESNTTWAVMVASTTPVALATTYLVVDAVVGSTVNSLALQATTAGKTAGYGCTLVGATGGANIQASAEE